MITYTYALGRYHNKDSVQLFYGEPLKVEEIIRGIAKNITDRTVERVNIKYHSIDAWDETVIDVYELNREIGSEVYSLMRV